MIYRGFNKNEVKQITAILEKHRVSFNVTIPDSSMEFINDPTKRVNHKFMDSLLQIEIEKSEFDKISEADIHELANLRIFREEDSPFTEEELSAIGESVELKVKKKDDHARLNQIAALLAILIMGLMFLKKQGLF